MSPIRSPLFAIGTCLVLMAAGCDKAADSTSDNATPSATAKPTAAKAAAAPAVAPEKKPASPAATKAADASDAWSPEVKRGYDLALKIPAERVADVSKQLRQLARLGLKAKPALEKIAATASLPEPHRAISGLVLADLYAFDQVALKRLATHDNLFAQSAAMRQLASHGGAELRKHLQGLVAKRGGDLGSHTKKIVDAMPDDAVATPRQLKLLQQIQLTPKSPSAIKASAKLVVDAPKVADWGARKAVALNGATSDTQMLAAVMLSRVHATDFEALNGLVGRKQNKFVRYEAFKKLALLGERGKGVIRGALSAGKDPLKPQLERLLSKPAAKPATKGTP